MLFFKQGLAAVCTTEDYTGHEKALTKKDTFEGGNFSKTIFNLILIDCVHGYKKIKR